MLVVDSSGMCANPRIKLKRMMGIEHGSMSVVHGIIVHQTDSPTAQSNLNTYLRAGAYGAHFLIDRDGTIYQTASLYKQTWHVGNLKARCLVEKRCTPAEVKSLSKRTDPRGENKREAVKWPPDRFPSNVDSIGIEIVGEALPRGDVKGKKKVFETVNDAQNQSLKWLVGALTIALGVPMNEIIRHPEVSRKNETEASTARW